MPTEREILLVNYIKLENSLSASENPNKIMLDMDELRGRLNSIFKTSNDKRWKLAYSHFVCGLSLTKCAEKYYYSRGGVGKIINHYRHKAR